jgi:soluble lytic murein transglycosylase-like protein
MFNRFINATGALGGKAADQSAAIALIIRDTVAGFMTAAHHVLMVLGVAAISALAFMFVKPEVTDHLKALSPFAAPASLPVAQEPAVSAAQLASAMDTPGKPFSQAASADKKLAAQLGAVDLEIKTAVLSREQQAVAKWLSRRYRVAGDATHMLVAETYKVANELKLDPLLILAVAAIESRFNPYAESSVGAQGLMQVMSKVHKDKFRELGGVKAALNPVANIRVGALILKEYVRRGGSVETGLKWYVGAALMETDQGYGARVLGEYRRLQEVAAGKNVPIFSTVASKSVPKPAATDSASEPKAVTADEDKSAALAPQRNSDKEESEVISL